MLTSATVSIFRLTCSCCPAVNLTGSVTSRQPSWTGQKTHHTWPSTSQCLTVCRSNGIAHLNLCVLYYLAERRIWRCVSLSQWHLNSETRTTWLHSTVRFNQRTCLLLSVSGLCASSFLDKGQQFFSLSAIGRRVIHLHTLPHEHTQNTHTHSLRSLASFERLPIITRPLVHTTKDVCVSRARPHTHIYTHILLTCSGKCITAANQPTLCLLSTYKRCAFQSRSVCAATACHGDDQFNAISYSWKSKAEAVIGFPWSGIWFRLLFVSVCEGEVVCEPPNNKLDRFCGTLYWRDKKYNLTNQNMLLRGCVLRNTEACYGLVIFAGLCIAVC